MVKEYKGTVTPLLGKEKLTEKGINFLQKFYEIAIRQNSGNFYEMKKVVGIILWNCTDMKDIEKFAISSAQKENPVGVNIKGIKTLEKKHTNPISIFQSVSMISANQFLLSYHLITYYQKVSMGVHKIQTSHFIVLFR